jgi:hypothetical protein
MDVPIIGSESPTENEQRALGGLFVVGPDPETTYDMVQVEVPVGVQRALTDQNKTGDTDQTVGDVLDPRSYSGTPQGFPEERELARFGSGVTAGTAKADAVAITNDLIVVIEIKSANEAIDGLHDAYQGIGQVLMNRDRLVEDYPSLTDTHYVVPMLLAEKSSVSIDLLAPTLKKHEIIMFDPVKGGVLYVPEETDADLDIFKDLI